MMKKVWILLILLCILPCIGALSQTLPTVDMISPGMMKWQISLEAGHTLDMFAVPSVQSLFHIRDISVLHNIFSQLRLESCIWQTGERMRLTVYAGLDRISDVDLLELDDAFAFSLDGTAYQLNNGSLLSDLDKLENLEGAFRQMFSGHSFLERFSMADIRNILQNQSFFGMLPGNCSVQNVTVQETYSDDRLRLTMLDISGTLYQGKIGAWKFSGFIRRPGGTKPKDTAELKFTKDVDNYLELSLSSQYSTENVTKEKSGTVKGDIRTTVSGKLNGYAVFYTLVLKIKNEWSADGINLNERITVTPEISWKDNTPGKNYLHLNSGKLVLKNIIRVSSVESEKEISMISDNVSVNLTMDGNDVVAGTLDLSAVLNELAMPEFPENAQSVTAEQMRLIYSDYIKEISRSVYEHLDQGTKDKVLKGLR